MKKPATKTPLLKIMALSSWLSSVPSSQAFVGPSHQHQQRHQQHHTGKAFTITSLQAAPKRLEENVDGVVYVNEKCINCAACSNFAPSVFKRADKDYAHIVYHQPSTREEILDARAAMAACPVAAIRSETLAQRRHVSSHDDKDDVTQAWTDDDEHLARQMALSPKVNGLELPFPRPLLHHAAPVTADHGTFDNHHVLQHTNANTDNNQQQSLPHNVYNVGHHNPDSFGATPYLVQARVHGRLVWIMVDTPRYNKAAVETVTSVTGPDGPAYLVLTHVDDTADHDQWAVRFPTLQRIFHAGDTGRNNWRRDRALDNDVEILLPVPNGPSPPPLVNDNNNNNDDKEQQSPFYAYAMDGTLLPSHWYQEFLEDPDNDVVVLHTPGHSPGSITLWKKPTTTTSNGQQDSFQEPGILFTGDHYAYSAATGRMTGFPRYGHNLPQQEQSLLHLLHLKEWDIIAAGHGHPRDYGTIADNDQKESVKRQEMEDALVDLRQGFRKSQKWN